MLVSDNHHLDITTFINNYYCGKLLYAANATMSDLDYLKNWLYNHSSNAITHNNYREMLKEFELFFTYVFNSSRDGISILDLDFTILGVNYTIERWYSHKQPLVGKKCYQIYHDNICPCEHCPTLEAIMSGKSNTGIVPYEVPGTVKGRQELSVFPLYDDRNKMFGVVEYARDITLQHEEETVIDNLKKRLQLKDKTLEEQETALKVILQYREKSEEQLAGAVVQNMNTLVDPLLDRLECEVNSESCRELLLMLKERLRQITSPFLKKLNLNAAGLTQRELEIASFIRNGKTSKEISFLLGISVKGVEFHRLKIRAKLGLSNTNKNLYSHLTSLPLL